MGRKVLIIEDDRNFAETLKNIFTDKRMEAKISFSAQQAEQFIVLEKYDLLIVDLVLPKINGIEFLKRTLPKGVLHSKCKIWLISGVLNEKIVSRDIMSHVDEFITKPLSRYSIEKKIDALFAKPTRPLKNLPFFYMSLSDKKTDDQNNLLNDKEYLIKAHELMFICLYLNSIRFDGILSVTYTEGKTKDEILFKKGNVVSFTFVDNASYIGTLLVRNQCVTQEVIDQFLKEDTGQPLGERLIADCYISPHQLHKVLKEQLAIKLFKVMGYSSIKINCQEFISSVQFDQFSNLEFRDFLSLMNNWVCSKVSMQWLKEFFNSKKDMYVVPTKNPAFLKKWDHYPALKFLSSEVEKEKKTVLDILNNPDRKKDQIMRELYCRLLIKESHLEYSDNEYTAFHQDYSFMKKKYHSFLKESKSKNYFELLNLPLNAPISQIDEVYKTMVKIFHPDRRDKNMPKDLVDIYDQCFILIQNIYRCLTDPIEKDKYIHLVEQGTKEGMFAIKTKYMKGKKYLEDGLYNQALNQFKEIFKSKLAPGDIILYYLWALLKSEKFKEPTTLDLEKKEKLTELFDKVGFDYRQTALFYFVKGLFMKVTGNLKSSFDCFTKAILMDPKLSVARVEKYSLSKKRKSRNKKSLMSLFKKGA